MLHFRSVVLGSVVLAREEDTFLNTHPPLPFSFGFPLPISLDPCRFPLVFSPLRGRALYLSVPTPDQRSQHLSRCTGRSPSFAVSLSHMHLHRLSLALKPLFRLGANKAPSLFYSHLLLPYSQSSKQTALDVALLLTKRRTLFGHRIWGAAGARESILSSGTQESRPSGLMMLI